VCSEGEKSLKESELQKQFINALILLGVLCIKMGINLCMFFVLASFVFLS
jgi:hypothetical protein